MKSVWISIIIFVFMIIGIFFSLNYLNKACLTLEDDSQKLETLINNEKWTDSYKLSKKLFDEWEKRSKIMPIFVNHLEVEQINNEILKLTQYVKCQNKDESLASTHVIKFYLDNIRELQKVNIQNIF